MTECAEEAAAVPRSRSTVISWGSTRVTIARPFCVELGNPEASTSIPGANPSATKEPAGRVNRAPEAPMAPTVAETTRVRSRARAARW